MDNQIGYVPAWSLWCNAARLQLRVIAALVRRETRAHFGESRLGYLWALIEPALHLTAFALLFGYVFRRSNPLGGNLTLFMLTGLIPYFLYYKLATYLAGAIEGNRALLNLPPVKPLDVLVSRGILEASTYLFVGFIALVGLFVAGIGDALPHYPLRLAVALTVILGFGFGVGIANAVIRVFIRNWASIFMLCIGPIYLLSGIWFLPEEIPPPFRDYLLYNPLMHFIMWVRSSFYVNYDSEYLDKRYATASTIVVFVLALALVRVARRKLLEPT
jgi:capsular polysaccharide transport system permease protein